jgi:hypothetical protein
MPRPAAISTAHGLGPGPRDTAMSPGRQADLFESVFTAIEVLIHAHSPINLHLSLALSASSFVSTSAQPRSSPCFVMYTFQAEATKAIDFQDKLTNLERRNQILDKKLERTESIPVSMNSHIISFRLLIVRPS